MARYKVTGPDGKTYELDGPEGASDAEVIAQAQRLLGAAVPRETQQNQQPAKDSGILASVGRAIKNNVAGNLAGAAGIGATILAPIDMARDTIAGDFGYRDRNAERRNSIRDFIAHTVGADTDSVAYIGGKLANEIAGTAGVGPTLGGAKVVATATPRLASALRTGGMTTGGVAPANAMQRLADTGIRIAGGGVTGAAGGALVDPSNAITGAIVGGALPLGVSLVGSGANLLGRLAKPLTDAGKDYAAAKYLRSLLGADESKVVQDVKNAFKPATGPFQPGLERDFVGEIVPGSVPTIAQASGHTNLAALQNTLTGVPESRALLAHQIERQQANRAELLNRIAGDKTTLARAETALDDATNPLRDAGLREANIAGVNTDKLIRQINARKSMPGDRQNTVLTKSLDEVKDRILNLERNDVGNANSFDLYQIRKEIGDIVARHARDSATSSARRASGIEHNVQRWIDDAIEAAGGRTWKQ